MSVEVIAENERPCPCGSGTYSVTTSANDWGGATERWTMGCRNCRSEYALLEYAYREKDRQWLGYVWIDSADRKRLDALTEAIDDSEKQLLIDARAAYFDRWMELTQSASTKKQLWSLLTNDGARPYPKLPTFYNHVRRIGLEHSWASEFSYPNLSRIVEVIDPSDQSLADHLTNAAQRRTERDEFEESLVENGFS
jgi:hypothetical protein